MNSTFPPSRNRNLRLFVFSLSGTLLCFLAIALFSYRYQDDSPLKGMFQRGVTGAEPQIDAPAQQSPSASAGVSADGGNAPASQPVTAEPARQENIPTPERSPENPEKSTTAVPEKMSEPATTKQTDPGVDSKSVSAEIPAE